MRVSNVRQCQPQDVFVDACIGGNQKLHAPFLRATLAAAAIGGVLYVASYGEHEIAGVAAWFGPGRALLDRSVHRSFAYSRAKQLPN